MAALGVLLENHASTVPAGVLLALIVVKLKVPDMQAVAWLKVGAVLPALHGAGVDKVIVKPSTEKYEPLPDGNEVVDASI